MKTKFAAKFLATTALILTVAVVTKAATASVGGWAAIAYNQSTGTWGEAHGLADLGSAEASAQAACGAGCTIVSWVNNGYVALATGDSGWGVSDGKTTSASANSMAVEQCKSVTTNCTWRIVASGFDK